MSTPYAYFQKKVVPLADAKIGIMTHAFNYGTGVFEGIRGNWNADDNTIYMFKVDEHLKRLRQSAKIMHIGIAETDAEIKAYLLDVVARSEIRGPYIRPWPKSLKSSACAYDLEDDLLIFVAPFGAPGVTRAFACRRRPGAASRRDPGAGGTLRYYINSALATEAVLNGFDEMIMLNNDGQSEGSGERRADPSNAGSRPRPPTTCSGHRSTPSST